jgi:hypothetical protein
MALEPHVGEAAELYAIGALEPFERAALEAHIAGCSECLRRVGEAEETVLALEEIATPATLPLQHRPMPFQRRGVPAWWVGVVAAAALIVGFMLPKPVSQHDIATLAMIGSHFSHAQFAGSGPPAKVLYARDRSWYYVIVSGSHSYAVYGIANGASTALGQTRPRGATSDLFTRVRARFDRLELRDGGVAIESAAIR